MQKIVLLATAVVLFLSGCASFDSETLSESEQLTVIDMARFTITGMEKNKKFVSLAEAAYINKNMPEVKIKYTGPRQGKMTISWTLESRTLKGKLENRLLKGKVVNFVYSGKFLTDSAMWRMGIVKYEENKSKKKTKMLDKNKKVGAAYFKDLRKK